MVLTKGQQRFAIPKISVVPFPRLSKATGNWETGTEIAEGPDHCHIAGSTCPSSGLRSELRKQQFEDWNGPRQEKMFVIVCLSMRCKTRMEHLHYIRNKEHFQWIAMIELFQSVPSSGSLRDADMVICCEHCAAIKVHVSPLVMCPASAAARLKKASQKATKARRRRRLAPWHIETIEKWDYSDTVTQFSQSTRVSRCVCDEFKIHIFSSLLLTCWWTIYIYIL